MKVIGKVADPQTGNLPVRILVENADGKLKLGQAVSATIVVREENALAVPVEAVQDAGEDPFSNVLRDGKTVVLHPKLGLKDEHWIVVSDTDLKPDEPVITEGGYNLPEGTEVAVEKVPKRRSRRNPSRAPRTPKKPRKRQRERKNRRKRPGSTTHDRPRGVQ